MIAKSAVLRITENADLVEIPCFTLPVRIGAVSERNLGNWEQFLINKLIFIRVIKEAVIIKR